MVYMADITIVFMGVANQLITGGPHPVPKLRFASGTSGPPQKNDRFPSHGGILEETPGAILTSR